MHPSRIMPLAIIAVALLALSPHGSVAGGYLWLGSEFQGEGNLYRYNLTTNGIDRVVSPPSTDHWNNIATLGGHVYLGNPQTGVFNRHDAYTGALVTPGTHAPALAGHKEDGASLEGSVWLMTYSGGALHRMTTAGVRETTFTVTTGLVGLEFVNGQGYATNYNTGRIGRLTRGVSSWGFVPAVWRAGSAPAGNMGALAYDPQTAKLYMTTSVGRLYSVTVANDTATATQVIDLTTVGYPVGGLVDGMGWVSPEASVDVPTGHLPERGSIELGSPSPNPARESVWFTVRLLREGRAQVGIYDVVGRRLRAWDLPGLAAGQSQFHWDLRTADGRRVGPGQFYVRLEAHGERSVRSFTVVE